MCQYWVSELTYQLWNRNFKRNGPPLSMRARPSVGGQETENKGLVEVIPVTRKEIITVVAINNYNFWNTYLLQDNSLFQIS